MRTYRAVARDGSECGRLLARSLEEAVKDAARYWPGREITVHEVKLGSG